MCIPYACGINIVPSEHCKSLSCKQYFSNLHNSPAKQVSFNISIMQRGKETEVGACLRVVAEMKFEALCGHFSDFHFAWLLKSCRICSALGSASEFCFIDFHSLLLEFQTAIHFLFLSCQLHFRSFTFTVNHSDRWYINAVINKNKQASKLHISQLI